MKSKLALVSDHPVLASVALVQWRAMLHWSLLHMLNHGEKARLPIRCFIWRSLIEPQGYGPEGEKATDGPAGCPSVEAPTNWPSTPGQLKNNGERKSNLQRDAKLD